MKQSYQQVLAYVTKDGSQIRELMHPQVHGNVCQSLAEAIIEAGGKTVLHRHRHSEELYHVTQGYGRMYLGNEEFELGPGDTVCIPPGVAHCIAASNKGALHILCCCAPAYSHEDTELLE